MKPKFLSVDGESLSIRAVIDFINQPKKKLKPAGNSLKKVKIAQNFLARAISENNKIIYGINTGFGPMANYILAPEQLLELQNNLIISHAVGVGDKIRDDFVLAAMMVRLNTLLKGYSG